MDYPAVNRKEVHFQRALKSCLHGGVIGNGRIRNPLELRSVPVLVRVRVWVHIPGDPHSVQLRNATTTKDLTQLGTDDPNTTHLIKYHTNLGTDAGSADDGVQRVCLLRHSDVNGGEDVFQLSLVLHRVSHRVHINLEPSYQPNN